MVRWHKCPECGRRFGHRRCCTKGGTHDMQPMGFNFSGHEVGIVTNFTCRICGYRAPITDARLLLAYWQCRTALALGNMVIISERSGAAATERINEAIAVMSRAANSDQPGCGGSADR